MKTMIDKLVRLEMLLAKEKGPFDLFALLLREDGYDKWDLVASALWIEKDYNSALGYVTKKLHSTLNTDELLKISKIVLIDEFDERVRYIQKAVKVEHHAVELREHNFFGLRIELAYVITSKVQADRELTKVLWDVLTEIWKTGERAIDSSVLLEALKKKGQEVPLGGMRRVLDFLNQLRCIRAAKYVDRDAIKEHGAMTITSVSPYCPELESHFKKQEHIDLFGLDGKVFDLGYEKWLLQVDEVFEHQGPWVTYYLRFMNPNAPAQERKLNVNISYNALATQKKDGHGRPERLWQWIYGWLFDKRPTETLNFDEEFEMQQV